MSGDFTGQIRLLVDDGDRAFNAGDFVGAAGHYRAARAELTEVAGLTELSEPGRPTSSGAYLLAATVLHRVAATEVLTGDPETAERLFHAVIVATDEARLLTTNDDTARFALDLAEQSIEQAGLLYGQRTTGSFDPGDHIGGVPTITLTAVCQHGCPAITTPCGYADRHCG